MNKHPNSQGYLRKRKMLLVLPLLVLPFITLAFWALGGGKTGIADKNITGNKQGLNLQLPDARLKDDKGLNKLSYYEMAAADSAKLKERMRNDPYFKVNNITTTSDNEVVDDDTSAIIASRYSALQKTGLKSSPYNKKENVDPNEEKILTKLQQLNTALDNSITTTPSKKDKTDNYSIEKKKSVNNDDISNLENMLQTNKQTENSGDPEMRQISGMLDKIMDIQHPERISDRLQQNSLVHKQEVFPVSGIRNRVPVSLLSNHDNGNTDTTGAATNEAIQMGFYSLEDKYDSHADENSALSAVVHETQTVVAGSTVKLRLLDDMYINGTLVTKDNFVFGTASLSGERLIIDIKSIRNNNVLFPVALAVYDMDGMDGIYIPGAIARNSAKESSDKAIQSVALSNLDPTLGAQAASAGIEAAKTLLSKKVKLIKVTLKAGYKVLLKDNNRKYINHHF